MGESSMKNIAYFVIGICLGSISAVAMANPYDWKVTRVIDGDTVAFKADFMPAPLKPELSIRVLGVDTPEKGHRASCPQEAAAAEKASQFTKDTLNNAYKNKLPVLIEIQKHDKYGGRVLGDVIVNGERLSALLIANGHARAYHGEKKTSWCN
jgi:endonuclease YncB( thermonuclease family)